MNRRIQQTIIILGILLSGVLDGYGQLSPGELTRSHADLEGLRNCTLCHVLGDKVSNDKCLDCHKVLKSRISARKGYHASREVKGKECATCHSEHHGRNFEMIRFEEKSFDHRLTGYDLTGAHRKIDCRDCHKPDRISDREIRARKNTYLGLGQECLSCHEDSHQRTLGTDCASCHTTEAFAPATRFDHNKTDFALAGKHRDVDCAKCHLKETREGKSFQRFADVSFDQCSTCHEDPHQNQHLKRCDECHTEQAFSDQRRLSRFNHSRTAFPLKGKHQQTSCAKCHSFDASPRVLFTDRSGIQTSDCVQCHEDVHEGRFGTACAECHQEESFTRIDDLDNFNHGLTEFALLGKHQQVDCRDCHKESLTDPLPHNTCASCHTDYHEGQFTRENITPDCADCHTVDGFQGSLFSFEDHAQTGFPLDGAHLATPCFACHLQGEKWQFKDMGSTCVDCHDDVHAGQIPQKYYPDNRCDKCHLTSRWRDSQFDHDQTPFQLLGIHVQQECRACHVPEPGFTYGKFVDLETACSSCHENVHDRQFELEGVTDCARCHGFEGWSADHFDHSQTAFPLEGKHAEIDCDACHKEVVQEGVTFVLYKIEQFECIDCHK
ncbi:MAG: hypothetical protein K9I85_09535 [Saprospiraceae bacterium]|nr:hypothetical protein [Saprospiraceae bacterium]